LYPEKEKAILNKKGQIPYDTSGLTKTMNGLKKKNTHEPFDERRKKKVKKSKICYPSG